jgi:ATP adenylyltransferase
MDQETWKQRLLLYRDEHALVLMNKYPYTGGHLLIAPLRHTCEAEKLTEAESYSMWRLSFLCIEVLKKVMRPQGFNLGMNLGKAAGAGIEDHLHMHTMPRWVGDTNFLPVIGDTHTIPVALEGLWDELRPAFTRAAKKAGLKGN